MTTITIDLPDDLAVRLTQQAHAFKTSITELAEAFVIRGIEDEELIGQTWHPSLTPDDIVAIEAGIADAAAGRVYTQQAVMQELQEILDR